MDFGTLLHVAKKNSESNKNEGKYYSTKFAPPKKEPKDKKLSENIQKFLKKREEEEKERQRLEREKLAALLSKRDEKSKNKIRKMLKVTKSANKSVLDDAINTDHTAVTLDGPDQPDQDDYGYVSTEANAFYQKYIEKVKDVKEDKGFAPSRAQVVKDLSGTKERVKAAITREIEDKKGHNRQRSSTTTAAAPPVKDEKVTDSSTARSQSSAKSFYDPVAEQREQERKKREEEQKKAKSRKPAPPPMDFQALLKLAEKKQHEPIEICVEEKKKEPERLLTLKEKREFEERQREREARERRKRGNNKEFLSGKRKDTERVEGTKNSSVPITKLNSLKNTAVASSETFNVNNRTSSSSLASKASAAAKNSIASSNIACKKTNVPASSLAPSSSQNVKQSTQSLSNAKSLQRSNSASSLKKNVSTSSLKPAAVLDVSNSGNSKASSTVSNKSVPQGGLARESTLRDTKTIKPRQFPPADVQQKTRQFPPQDVRREPNGKKPTSSQKPQQAASKRRILDLDDEDEYDSELDDFIDDGDDCQDYSSHIKAIFGYDKSRYRDIDDDDDAAMESNFAQVQREEYISKKIGIQEDLEDMKLEAAQKKRKVLMKKKTL